MSWSFWSSCVRNKKLKCDHSVVILYNEGYKYFSVDHVFVYCTLHSCLVSQYLLQSLNSLTNYRQYLQAICLTEASQERENWTCIRSTTRQQKTCPPQTLPCPNPCHRYWKCTLTCMSVLWIITTWTRLFIQKNKWPPTIDYRLIIETDTSWHLMTCSRWSWSTRGMWPRCWREARSSTAGSGASETERWVRGIVNR